MIRNRPPDHFLPFLLEIVQLLNYVQNFIETYSIDILNRSRYSRHFITSALSV